MNGLAHKILMLAIIAPGVSMLMAEFESSSTVLAAFVVSVFVLGVSSFPSLQASQPSGARI